MSLFDRWSRKLHSLNIQSRLRELRQPAGVDFTSNDYLGYKGTVFRTSQNSQVSGMSSRLLRGNDPIWEVIESKLASWHMSESTLMMTSGYAANEGLLSSVIQAGDWVASD